MPADQPLSRGARRLLVRLCRSNDGVSLEGLDGEAVAAAEELYDAGAIDTRDETIVVAAWAVEWAKREPRASELELSESDLVGTDDTGALLDATPDPAATDPHEAAAKAEEEERRPRKGDHGKAGLPKPTVILGLSHQWPALTIPCRGCGGNKLPRTWYCAADGCDRSGLDNVIGRVQPLPLDKPDGPKREWAARRDSSLAGGTGPAASAG